MKRPLLLTLLLAACGLFDPTLTHWRRWTTVCTVNVTEVTYTCEERYCDYYRDPDTLDTRVDCLDKPSRPCPQNEDGRYHCTVTAT